MAVARTETHVNRLCAGGCGKLLRRIPIAQAVNTAVRCVSCVKRMFPATPGKRS